MNIDTFLSMLEGAKRTAPDRGIARCPSHQDRSPSLSVRETGDGHLLVFCHAGCPVESIVAAMNLTMGDLFPNKPAIRTARPAQRPRLRADEALAMLGHEIATVALILHESITVYTDGGKLSRLALERLAIASARINKIRNFVDSEVAPELVAIRRGGVA